MPLARHWLRDSVVLFVITIALGLVAVHTHAIQPHDLSLDKHLEADTRTAWLTHVMNAISNIVSPVGGVIIIAVWCGWLLLARRQPVKAVSTFLVIAIGWNITELAKVIVARHRPPVSISLAPETGSDSFPSGHTSLTLSLAIAAYFLARGTRWQRPVAVGGAVAVLLVMFDRLYLGVHYPTDVLGSLLITTAAVTCLTGVWHRWLLPNLHLVPLLARFGPVPGPRAGAAPGESAVMAADTGLTGRR
jgi:undecaprenyl-diphosphatase